MVSMNVNSMCSYVLNSNARVMIHFPEISDSAWLVLFRKVSDVNIISGVHGSQFFNWISNCSASFATQSEILVYTTAFIASASFTL